MASSPLRPPYLDDADSAFTSEPRASYLAPSDRAPSSSQLISPADKVENDTYAAAAGTSASSPLANHNNAYAANSTNAARKPRRPLFWAVLGALALAALVLVIVLPVYFTVVKPRNQTTLSSPSNDGGNNDHTSEHTPEPSGSPTSPVRATTGTDGSEIIDEDGNTFTYRNSFGGHWVYDPENPRGTTAQIGFLGKFLFVHMSELPSLPSRSVNLGGLFQLEPFISPELFQRFPGAVDEWTLTTLMAADTANGGLRQLEEHYRTFITEEDMAQIAGAGLNWIRLPIPFWAVDIWNGTEGHSPNTLEPFLAKTSWKYIVRVLGWARKYGIRVCLDLHSMPGSQNGYNHSGKLGQVNFLYGNMGIANAQRGLSYIRTITEFANRPEWRNVVLVFGIVNELLTRQVGVDVALSL
ncbi:hypothetical protein ONZ45_g19714 [Pleurotus djamor]|nr:hypothetical protein ONZ45_g19714 [Pleurotus djamor]